MNRTEIYQQITALIKERKQLIALYQDGTRMPSELNRLLEQIEGIESDITDYEKEYREATNRLFGKGGEDDSTSNQGGEASSQ